MEETPPGPTPPWPTPPGPGPTPPGPTPPGPGPTPPEPTPPTPPGPPTGGRARLGWSGDVPPPKWMNFYMKVLARFATDPSLKLTVTVDVEPTGGLSPQRVEEVKAALRELGLGDDVE